jgi:uncharacterized membrane protein
MTELILAAAFFSGFHLGVAGTRARDILVARFGENIYRAGFSLVSLIGLGWLIRAYGQAPYIETWGQLAWFRPVAVALMPVAVVLVVASLTRPNPAAMGGEKFLAASNPAVGVFRITRHPMLWGIAVWALLHLIANGDAASLVLFGSLLILALAGTHSIDAKRARSGMPGWERFAAVTSNLPFRAIRQGRSKLEFKELWNWRLALALAVYLALLHFHAAWFGVSPLL